MIIAHVGLAIVALGVLGAGVWRTETVQRMQRGDVIRAGAYEARLVDVVEATGPNFVAENAVFAIEKNGKPVREMKAERR
ncbi:MAG TPA: c-type cytochrome biogenesis protein CcmF, partial [Parvularcula sp.]|nr:c-type cytochrome biogenesis protein CcmF [Parvularcula sp.]